MIKVNDMIVFKRTEFGEREVGKFLGTEPAEGVDIFKAPSKNYVVQLLTGEVIRFNYYCMGRSCDAMGNMAHFLGWLVVKADFEDVDRGYECAAWYEKIKVSAGTRSPIWAVENACGRFDMVYAELDGTVVSDDFGGRFFGVPLSNYDNFKNAGKRSSHFVEWRGYTFAEWVCWLGGDHDFDDPYNTSYKLYELELLPNVSARKESYISSIDEKEHLTASLVIGEV